MPAQNLKRQSLTYSIKEASDLLGISENALRNSEKRGNPCGIFRIGRSLRVSKKVVQRITDVPQEFEVAKRLIAESRG